MDVNIEKVLQAIANVIAIIAGTLTIIDKLKRK